MNVADPSETVQQALDCLLPGTRVQRFTQSTATAPDAAEAIGCAVGAIVKSLLFLVDGRPVVVLVAGDRQASDAKLAARAAVGRKRVRMADAAAVLTLTGYAIGGVPPIGHATRLPVLIDESLERFQVLYAAAGTDSTVFPVTPDELRRITKAEIADVVR